MWILFQVCKFNACFYLFWMGVKVWMCLFTAQKPLEAIASSLLGWRRLFCKGDQAAKLLKMGESA